MSRDWFMGCHQFLIEDAPFLRVQSGGMKDDVFRVGAELRRQGVIGVESEEPLKRFATEDRDRRLVLSQYVLTVGAEAKAIEIHPQGWRQRDL